MKKRSKFNLLAWLAPSEARPHALPFEQAERVCRIVANQKNGLRAYPVRLPDAHPSASWGVRIGVLAGNSGVICTSWHPDTARSTSEAERICESLLKGH